MAVSKQHKLLATVTSRSRHHVGRMFELLCARAVSGSSAYVAAVVHRPGSEPVLSLFSSDFFDLLDQLMTSNEDDVNIILDGLAEPATIKFMELLAVNGLEVVSRKRLVVVVVVARPILSLVSVVDVVLIDHRQLQLSSSLERPVCTMTTRRQWPWLDTTVFQDAVSSSSYC